MASAVALFATLTLFAALTPLAALATACSAPAQIRDLQSAEDNERAGRAEQALRDYRSAQVTCKQVESARRRRDSCASAHLQYAELLVTLERPQEAIAAYRHAEQQLAQNIPAAAQACFSLAGLYRRLGNRQESVRFLWRSVDHYSNEAFAADALKWLLLQGRKRDPNSLRAALAKRSRLLAGTQVADNLLEALAQLSEKEFHAPKTALRYYDQIAREIPNSGFYDDALWHGARLSRQLGDAAGAVQRLRTLLSTRVVAFGPGSYFSVWLDNAQLELGVILRDDLHDLEGAIKAFSRLPNDYPASILRDDALYQRACTHALAGDSESACKDLKALRSRFPDSKYELEAAPKLRVKLACNHRSARLGS